MDAVTVARLQLLAAALLFSTGGAGIKLWVFSSRQRRRCGTDHWKCSDGACLPTLPLALPLASGSPVDWLIIAYLWVFQVGLASVCLSAGVRCVPAVEASMLLLLEPVLNPAWAWAVHGEFPGTWALVGGAVIIRSTAAKTWIDASRRACARRPKTPFDKLRASGKVE